MNKIRINNRINFGRVSNEAQRDAYMVSMWYRYTPDIPSIYFLGFVD